MRERKVQTEREAIGFFSYPKVLSIPNDQPRDVQTEIDNVEDENQVMHCVWRYVEIASVRFAWDSADRIKKPRCLPGINQSPNAECPSWRREMVFSIIIHLDVQDFVTSRGKFSLVDIANVSSTLLEDA